VKKLLLFTIIITSIPVSGQSIQPFIINATGGSYLIRGSNSTKNFSLVWSVGESALIETFTATNGSIITQGVLQPVTEFDLQTAMIVGWTKEELKVYPVPVSDILQFDMFSRDTGKVSLQLYDIVGRLLSTREFMYNTLPINQQINFLPYAAGTYLLKISLYTNGILKKNTVFKILKLRK